MGWIARKFDTQNLKAGRGMGKVGVPSSMCEAEKEEVKNFYGAGKESSISG